MFGNRGSLIYLILVSAHLRDILTRIIACADNGYDTAELHAIVEDARKVVSG